MTVNFFYFKDKDIKFIKSINIIEVINWADFRTEMDCLAKSISNLMEEQVKWSIM